MKKITIDARMINSSGIGTYIKNLLPIIIKKMSHNQFYIIGNSEELNSYIGNYDNVTYIDLNVPIYSLKEQINLKKVIPKDTDLFFSPHYNIPLFFSGKLVTTVHDMFHIAMHQYLNSTAQKIYAKFMFKAVKLKSDKILTVSNFSKKEIIKYVNIDDSKVHVTYNGVTKNDNDGCYSDYKHNRKPYLLFIGNVKPHKNLIKLLEAFNLLPEHIDVELVIIGKKDGFINGDLKVKEFAKSMENKVRFTGYLSEEELQEYILYSQGLVFPSLYEGFGLPPLEAMIHGCPVIASNVASIPEICGDAVLYVDPYNPEDIANKIKMLLSNKELQEDLIQKGFNRVKKFTWENCAVDTINVIEEVLEK